GPSLLEKRACGFGSGEGFEPSTSGLSTAAEFCFWHSFGGISRRAGRGGGAGRVGASVHQSFEHLMRLTCPSTLPELHRRVSPAVTASWSACRPVTDEVSAGRGQPVQGRAGRRFRGN